MKLTGQDYVFVRFEHNKGVSKKTEQPYEFANATFSDGLESLKIPVDPKSASRFHDLQKGDYVTVTGEIYEQFNRTQFWLTDVEKQD